MGWSLIDHNLLLPQGLLWPSHRSRDAGWMHGGAIIVKFRLPLLPSTNLCTPNATFEKAAKHWAAETSVAKAGALICHRPHSLLQLFSFLLQWKSKSHSSVTLFIDCLLNREDKAGEARRLPDEEQDRIRDPLVNRLPRCPRLCPSLANQKWLVLGSVYMAKQNGRENILQSWLLLSLWSVYIKLHVAYTKTSLRSHITMYM